MPNPVERLTPAEKDALRLVASDRTAGEIAGILGKSPNTIENQIKSARAKLGGITGSAAARMLAEAEGRSHSLASLSLAIGATRPIDDQLGIDHPAGVAEDRAVFAFEMPQASESAGSSVRVSMSKRRRLLAIVGLVAVIGIGMFLALASVFVIQLLLKSH